MELTAERVVAGGDALAHAPDGRVVLVEGALPGERVRIEVTADRPDLLRARAIAVIEPASDRVAPPCPHARAGCGGCTWQHVAPVAQPALKLEILRDAFRRIAHIDDPPLAEPVVLPTDGYRTTVRVVVVGDRLAFRRRHAHETVTIDTCLVAHPLVDEVLRTGRFAGAREVTVRVGARTGERCVLADPATAVLEVPADVRQGPGAFVHEIVADHRFRISARSFFQTRVDGADALAGLVRDAVGHDRVIADLYCGVGLFSALVDAPRRVIAVERSRAGARDARHNLRERPARIVHADVARWRAEPADVVIADPSRAGLGREGAATVVRCRPERVVLISCDAAALARDTSLLAGAGYGLRSTVLVDLFPHTPHVECVSIFDLEP
ncbi:MAG TPA: TRAM domain-containing protein [Acidimicrobiia bacterium]|nr:TRAM domain-containing protein [Acidimicrobiia bacterium]